MRAVAVVVLAPDLDALPGVAKLTNQFVAMTVRDWLGTEEQIIGLLRELKRIGIYS